MTDNKVDPPEGETKRQRKRRVKQEREENRSTRSKILRSIFVPVAPWRSPMRTLSGNSAVQEASALSTGLKEARRLCPECGDRLQIENVVPTDENGVVQGEAYRALICNSCGHSESIEEAIEGAKKSQLGMKIAERQLFVFGAGIFVVFAVVSFFNRSIFTFVGGAVMGFTLLAAALFYRYRAWQSETGNLFLDKAPVKAWIKDELSK